MINIENILKYFPTSIYTKIEQNLRTENIQSIKNVEKIEGIENIEEIRVRIERPIILKIGQAEKVIEHKTTSEEIIQILEHICENSIYSYQKQICNRIYNN